MSIKVIKLCKEMQAFSEQARKSGKTIGFVPTMGYLHQGHISLLKQSTETADLSVVSVFVNPTQFAPTEDLTTYPRDFDRDLELLETNGADVLFFPEPTEIYPAGFDTFVNTESMAKVIEGVFRPTHFKGVCTVVSILFNIVKPHYSFFGQKDAQQAAIIKRMVKDLHFDIEIVVCPIVRESDGLAMSSRNVYLTDKQHIQANFIFESLEYAETLIRKGERKSKFIVDEIEKIIKKIEEHSIDYIKIVDAETFIDSETIMEGNEYYILIACKVGSTRLIDNILIKVV